METGAGHSAVNARDNGDEQRRTYLRKELERTIQTAVTNTMKAAWQARVWSGLHLFLGGGAAILAVVSGYASLASTDGRIPSAIFALAAAAFAAANAFLNCEARREWEQQRKSAWRGIEVDARLILGREAYQSSDRFHRALRLLGQRQKAIFAGDYTRALGVSSFQTLNAVSQAPMQRTDASDEEPAD